MMTAQQIPSMEIATDNRPPKAATLYTLLIDSRNLEQQPDYDRMFFNDKAGRNHEASYVLHKYIKHHGIYWKSSRVLDVTHYRHGNGQSGHFIIEALVFN